MPKLSPKESGICSRIRQVRDLVGISQARAAELIGISRERFLTYESGRTALRFDVGLRFCRQCLINEEWLATGKTDHLEQVAETKIGSARSGQSMLRRIFQRQCLDLLSEPVALMIPLGALFSDAFREILLPRYIELAQQFFFHPRVIFSDEPEPELASRLMTVQYERASLLLNHLALEAGVDAWLVQRNYLRALVSLAHKAYGDFHELGFDILAFQQLISTMQAVKLRRVADEAAALPSRQRRHAKTTTDALK